MISEEKTYPKDYMLIKENPPADKFILLLEGDVVLIHSGGGEGAICNALHGSIARDVVMGVSTLAKPYIYISSGRAAMPVKLVKIEGKALRALVTADQKLGYILMCNTAQAVL